MRGAILSHRAHDWAGFFVESMPQLRKYSDLHRRPIRTQPFGQPPAISHRKHFVPLTVK
jgi:hypothetical protein